MLAPLAPYNDLGLFSKSCVESSQGFYSNFQRCLGGESEDALEHDRNLNRKSIEKRENVKEVFERERNLEIAFPGGSWSIISMRSSAFERCWSAFHNSIHESF